MRAAANIFEQIFVWFCLLKRSNKENNVIKHMLRVNISFVTLLVLSTHLVYSSELRPGVAIAVDDLVQACRKAGTVGSLSAVLERNKADLSAASYLFFSRQVAEIEMQESKLRTDIEFTAERERLAKSLLALDQDLLKAGKRRV